jgi:hypothetical protein
VDWYGVDLDAGQTLGVVLDFKVAKGDLDLRLYATGNVTTPVAKAFETADVRAISSLSMRSLSTSLIDAFATEQLAALSTRQLQALSTGQLRVLDSSDLSAFSTQQIAGLRSNGYDVINFGAGNANGVTQGMVGFGFRSRVYDKVDLGFAYEIAMIRPYGLTNNRVTVDMCIRFEVSGQNQVRGVEV